MYVCMYVCIYIYTTLELSNWKRLPGKKIETLDDSIFFLQVQVKFQKTHVYWKSIFFYFSINK